MRLVSCTTGCPSDQSAALVVAASSSRRIASRLPCARTWRGQTSLSLSTSENPPRAFGGQTAKELGFFYRNAGKAWMSTDLFVEWVIQLDSVMRKEGHHILLLIDNAPVHDRIIGELLTNTRVHFLPANTTSHLQPLDQRIIANVKHYARELLTKRYMNAIEMTGQRPSKMNVLEAMQVFNEAWEQVKQQKIWSGWNKADICESYDEFGNQLGYSLRHLSLDDYEPITTDAERDITTSVGDINYWFGDVALDTEQAVCEHFWLSDL